MVEFVNQNFELPGGTAASLLSGSAEPFGLSDEEKLLVRVDGGDQQSILFEVGSRGSVLSGATETFVMSDGQTLDVDVDGGPTQTATFNTADFADISNATASEVAAVILTDVSGVFVFVESGAVRITTSTKGAAGSVQVTGGTANPVLSFPGAADSGSVFFADISNATASEVAAQVNSLVSGLSASDVDGRVRLESDTVGASSQLDVEGGAANVALAFNTEPVFGKTQLGEAFAWTIYSISTAFEVASLDSVFREPIEDFEEEWGQVDAVTFDPAVFDSPPASTEYENFEEEWNNGPTTLGSKTAAVFVDTSATSGLDSFEDYETWVTGSPQPSISFLGAEFDTSDEDEEDFEEEWGQSAAPSFEDVEFDGVTASAAETFEFNTTVQDVVEVNDFEDGELYQVTINGEPAVVIGATSTFNVAVQLAVAINNLSQPVTATPVSSTVELEADNPGDPFVTSVIGPPTNPSALTLSFPDPTTQWTGSSFLCL